MESDDLADGDLSAIEAYQLPMPAFTITDVGTKIYQQKAGGWRELVAGQEEIARLDVSYNFV